VKFNHSIPPVTVTPVLAYPDVRPAVDWLSTAFGAAERVRIGENHRAQMSIGGGAFIVAEQTSTRRSPTPGELGSVSIMVRLDDARAHCAAARAARARILTEPTDHMYGERQYSAEDLASPRQAERSLHMID
jgi:uncharacterized glyoxalase superfamily protein PhnB